MFLINSWLLITVIIQLKASTADIVNQNVERIIDLTSQLVKVTETITAENAGTEKEYSYVLAFEPGTKRNISFIGVKDEHNENLKFTETKINEHLDKQIFVVELINPIHPGRTAVIIVDIVFTHSLTPYPIALLQKDDQFVHYKGNHYFYTPYATVTQVTTVVLSTKNVEDYSNLEPVSLKDSTLTYGPYNDIGAFTLDPLTVHFQSNVPFLTVTRVERTLDVSHWGGISVEENIDILHTGAKLKGTFCRYQYQRERDTGNTHASVKSYKTILPASAHSIYYRDSNGNISTSHVRVRSDMIELELRPRFPLFGGWKTSYTLGYDVPSYQYLHKSSDTEFILQMRILDNVFDDMHVEELETNIILPVGVTDVNLITPYSVERLPDVVTYKYLDTRGRPIIRMKKGNLVEQHIQNFKITYNWKSSFMLHEPVLLSVTFYLMFLMVIVYVRLDFSIMPPGGNVRT